MPAKLKRPGDPIDTRKRGGRGAWIALAAAAVVVLAGVVLCGQESESPDTAASAAPTPVASSPPRTRELLDGLSPGDAIGSWKVHVLRVVDGQLGIDLLHGDKVLTVWIAKKGANPRPAPRETEKFVLYYGHPMESQAEAARDIEAILNEIEARVRRSEATATLPAGM